MATTNILDQIESGQIARLIPTVADSKKEERVTSSLLAAFTIVPSFAEAVLSATGAPFGKRAKISCYTEVVFKSKDKKRPRPDGLLVVTSGSRTWSAIVESKVGIAELRQDQVEEYLDLAREVGADALITLSNQFATLPTHHPVSVSKQKTRFVELFHFSWLSVLSTAILCSQNKQIEDPEQAYILNELVRYLEHDSSGVAAFGGMSKGWKMLCGELLQGAAINGKAEYVQDSVASWHQLLRYLCIRLSVAIGKPVNIYLSRARANDPAVHFDEDVARLLKDSCLHAEFEVPDAASRLSFSADILRRTINLSMKLDAPRDKTRVTAPINWLTRQLKAEGVAELTIRAYWPKRIPMTSAPLSLVLDDPMTLVPPNVTELPASFEVLRVIDLAARFRGSKTFVEDAEKAFPEFYADVGQRLTRWVPQPPKVKDIKKDDSDADSPIRDESSVRDSLMIPEPLAAKDDQGPDVDNVELKTVGSSESGVE